MIATSSPTGSIGSGKQGVDLFARERLDESPIRPFYGDSQYSCCQADQFWIAQSQPPKEGSNCGKADVPGSDAVMSIYLETIEKGQDHIGFQRSNGERRRLNPQFFVCKLKQQAKRVTVAGNGLRTDMFLLQQMLNEERLEQGTD